MVRDLVNIGGIWFERGLVCYCLACPERGSAELHHPFRDCIDMGIEFAAECAKHLTHANKLNPFKIHCACLVTRAKSMAYARREFRRSMETAFAFACKSIL